MSSTRRMWIVGAVVFIAGMAPAAADGTIDEMIEKVTQEIDFDSFANTFPWVGYPQEALRPVLQSKGWEMSSVGPAFEVEAGRLVTTWGECDKSTCRGWIGLLSTREARLKLVKKARLVGAAKPTTNSIEFRLPTYLDLDGDGVKEIVIQHVADAPTREALGWLRLGYYSFYSAKDLTLLFSREVSRAGGSQPTCRGRVRYGAQALSVTLDCAVGECSSFRYGEEPGTQCERLPKKYELWHKPAGAARYRRVSAYPKPSP